jgi:hypothetical protein
MAGHPHLPRELFTYDFIPLLRREKNECCFVIHA